MQAKSFVAFLLALLFCTSNALAATITIYPVADQSATDVENTVSLNPTYFDGIFDFLGPANSDQLATAHSINSLFETRSAIEFQIPGHIDIGQITNATFGLKTTGRYGGDEQGTTYLRTYTADGIINLNDFSLSTIPTVEFSMTAPFPEMPSFSFDLTSSLQQSNSQFFGILISCAPDLPNLHLASSDFAPHLMDVYSPRLTITYNTIPEPASVQLMIVFLSLLVILFPWCFNRYRSSKEC